MTQETKQRRGSSIYGKTREKLEKSRPINVTALKLLGQLEKIEAPTAERLRNGYIDIQDDDHLREWVINAQAFIYYIELTKIYTPESRAFTAEYLRTTDVYDIFNWSERVQIFIFQHQLQSLENEGGTKLLDCYVSFEEDPEQHFQWIKDAETYLKKNV